MLMAGLGTNSLPGQALSDTPDTEAAIRWRPRTAKALSLASGGAGDWGFMLAWLEVAWVVNSQGLSPGAGVAPANQLPLYHGPPTPVGAAGREAVWRLRLVPLQLLQCDEG